MRRTFEARTDLEALLVEQALLMARELQAASDAAPRGRLLADAEAASLRLGRELTRIALQAAVQSRAPLAEKKTHPPAPATAAGAATTRAPPPAPSSPPPAASS